MQRIHKNILAALLLLFSAAACDKKLDIDPTQSIDELSALSTPQDVQVTLTGAYDGMGDSDVYGGGIQFSSELLGDDREVIFGGTFTTLDELWRKTVTTTNTQVRDTWLNSYAAVNRANNVLSALDILDAADRSQVEGEARFIRGALYFGLVKLFAKAWGDGDNNANPGVPLVLKPTRKVTAEDNISRNSVAQVYTQILEDLTAAERLLPETKATADFSRATRNAASALLSRVYLQQGRYAEARDAANKVIVSGGNALEANFADVFPKGGESGEIIFRIAISDQDGFNNMNNFYASVDFQGRGDVRVQKKHLDLYPPGDDRGAFFTEQNNLTFTDKFNDQFADVPVVRLAEMYLTRAECNQRLGASVGATALSDVNTIRKRAGAPELASVNLSAILLERRLELAFEGLQIDDLKRNRANVGSKPFSDNSLVLPIPQREIDTNKSLAQNPGY